MNRLPHPRPLARTLRAILLLSLTAACGGSSSPTEPMAVPPSTGAASFRVVGAGEDQGISYMSGANLVLCLRDQGFADLFLRFAERTTAGGGDGPHLDIDVCNLGEGGTFQARDPRSTDCGTAKTWSVFWHDAETVYSNSPGAGSCTLQLQRSGTHWVGSFQCPALLELGGSRSVDLVDGAFDCAEG